MGRKGKAVDQETGEVLRSNDGESGHGEKIRELDYKSRVAEWNEEDALAEEAKKNRNFFMMFKQNGSPAVRKMIRLNGIAAELFLFIAENMDRSNALVGSGVAFADALDTSPASISRALKVLDEEGYIARFKSGGTNVIVANPDLVWNSWATGKQACLFNNAKVLISKGEQDPTLIRKFAHVVPKVKQDEPAPPSLEKKPSRPKKKVAA